MSSDDDLHRDAVKDSVEMKRFGDLPTSEHSRLEDSQDVLRLTK